VIGSLAVKCYRPKVGSDQQINSYNQGSCMKVLLIRLLSNFKSKANDDGSFC